MRYDPLICFLSQEVDAAHVSFDVGYDSPSQFSREYRRMFGAPPSRDAMALREKAALLTLKRHRKVASAR